MAFETIVNDKPEHEQPSILKAHLSAPISMIDSHQTHFQLFSEL